MRSEVQKLPALFLERLRKIIPTQKWDEVANTFAETKPTTFRVNTLKADPGIIQEKLEHEGFRLEKWGQSLKIGTVPIFSAFILRKGTLRELQETEFYKKGEIYVQSLSSMLPPLVLDPQPGERILDLTAAPGSKTTQMACLMKERGTIIANDNNRIRFFKLKANIELQGAAHVELSMRPGELFGRDLPESFDKVLLDAPCSAEGRFLVNEPSSYKYWKIAKIKEMARKQKNLILSAFRTLRPGGVLVYSTCTFAPEENEGVVDWLLSKMTVGARSPRPEGGETPPLQIEKITLPFTHQLPGLVKWEGEDFQPTLRNSFRILPTHLMEGFYMARLQKTGSP